MHDDNGIMVKKGRRTEYPQSRKCIYGVMKTTLSSYVCIQYVLLKRLRMPSERLCQLISTQWSIVSTVNIPLIDCNVYDFSQKKS